MQSDIYSVRKKETLVHFFARCCSALCVQHVCMDCNCCTDYARASSWSAQFAVALIIQKNPRLICLAVLLD